MGYIYISSGYLTVCYGTLLFQIGKFTKHHHIAWHGGEPTMTVGQAMSNDMTVS